MNAVRYGTANLLRVAHSFAATPRVMASLGELLRDPNAALEDVVLYLKHDSTLASRLLRIANSASFAPQEPVASIEAAATLIGFREIHRLVGAVSVDQFSLKNYPIYGFTGPQLRCNALLTAYLMEEIASFVGMDPAAAYTAGLFRSVGKLALAKLAEEDRTGAQFQPTDLSTPLALWEVNTFGQTSNEASASILNEWRFTAEVKQAIEEHYSPASRGLPTAYLLNLSAHSAELHGHGLPGESNYWLPVETCADVLSIRPRALEYATRRAVASYEQICSALV